MQKASSAKVGYLAILLAGLLLLLGVRFEANRQYLVAWQQYLEARQADSKDYTKRVSSFFSALNDQTRRREHGTAGAEVAIQIVQVRPVVGSEPIRHT